MSKIVYAVSANPNKIMEYKKILGYYGLDVRFFNSLPSEEKITSLLRSDTKIVALIKEISDLYNCQSSLKSSKTHMEVVQNISNMVVFYLHNDKLCKRDFKSSVDGYIDVKRKSKDKDVFGWDDIFVVRNTMLSLHEMKKKDIKVSARDLVFSDFIRDFLYYNQRSDLKFNPQRQQQTIDFTNLVSNFVIKNKYLNNPHMKNYNLDVLVQAVSNQGIFFKSAKNRREKTYWLPGLNGGLPLVSKGDDIHEITFMFHDLMHFLLPDLIFDGIHSDRCQRIYITHRMMSEAFTLCLADMLFVDTLKTSGVQYDFSKRKIHPLYEHLNLDIQHDFSGGLRKLLYANTRFALCGDISEYQRLLKPDDASAQHALSEYIECYTRFFVADYKWTHANYKNMVNQSEYIQQWAEFIEPWREQNLVGTVHTVTSFSNMLPASLGDFDSIVDSIFNVLLDNIVSHITISTSQKKKEQTLGFIKYMMGQLGIFAKFDFLHESKVYRDNILQYVLEEHDSMDITKINTVVAFFHQYVDLLHERHYISTDDKDTYKEVYPLFDPFYVSYDADSNVSLDALAEMQRLTLGS